MDITHLSILAISALVASFFSTASGSGGGFMLLAVLNVFYSPQVAIAIHAFSQIVSKATRVYVFKEYVKWSVFTPFAIGCLLGIVLASFTLYQMPVESLQLMIGVFLIIYALFKKHLKKMPFIKIAKNDLSFIPIGFLGGFISMGIGAAGPFMTPFLKENMPKKEVFISTKALFGLWSSICKSILIIGFLSFPMEKYQTEILVLFLFLFIGTLIGKKIHSYMSEKLFETILRITLFIIGFKILFTLLMSK